MNNIRNYLCVMHGKTIVWKRLLSHISAANVVTDWKQKFAAEKIDDPDFSLKCIMSQVLDVKFSTLDNYANLSLTETQKGHFDQLCECRMCRMPIQYIVGNWDFRNIVLRMVPPVFIPRPETEQLVQIIVDDLTGTGAVEFLEIGCGSGAITCSLLNELPAATGTAIDCSHLACNLTKHNSIQLGVDERLKLVKHKVTDDCLLPDEINRKFDSIISNPPYVKSADISRLAPEITLYEDLRALDGGVDGLKIVRLLCRIAEKNLTNVGKMWLEVDSAQIADIEDILRNDFSTSLEFVKSHKDLFGKDRFVEIARK